MNVENFPANKSWLLSLDKNPTFEKDDAQNGNNPLPIPPEERIVDAELYAGDALLFMGRHLIHFRRGHLPAGQWINQVFLHYVREDFSLPLS